MARPAHTLMTWSGVSGPSGAPSEEWSFSLRGTGGIQTPLSFDGVAEAMALAWTDNLAVVIGDNIRLTECTVADVDAGGLWNKDNEGAYVKGTFATNAAGIKTDPYMPSQCALVVSLTTARSGPSGKGRFYLPVGRANIQPDGRLAAAHAAPYADAAAAFVTDVNALLLGSVAVVSTKGYASPVTGIRLGRAIDTLRSRRRSLLEEYLVRSLPS